MNSIQLLPENRGVTNTLNSFDEVNTTLIPKQYKRKKNKQPSGIQTQKSSTVGDREFNNI